MISGIPVEEPEHKNLVTEDRTVKAAGALPGSCTLGSVKSQIGHTKCAAGLAVLLAACTWRFRSSTSW